MSVREYLRTHDFARNFFTKLSNNEVLFLGLLLTLPGISLAIAVDSPKLITKLIIAFITEMGFAFIIAWVIICTVDEREKKKHNEQVELDKRRMASRLYLNTVLDLDLPSSVTEELQMYIAGSKLLKKYQKVILILEKCGSYCKMTQIFEVVYVNVGRATVQWCPTFDSYDNRVSEIEEKNPGHPWGFNEVKIEKRKSGTDIWVDISPEDINKLAPEAEIKLSREVDIGPQDEIRVFIEQTCSKFASDNELFTNKALTDSLSLEVSYDRSEFEVSYRAVHPREDFSELKRSGGSDRIQFSHPFLPSHGFVVWWRPKHSDGKAESR
ncbi:hypothetical protein ACFOM8_07040 [Paracoccus angustae]|uniref:SMODS-associated and fused to various effectors domain-containing protein n=1 Tax=Paracoccus angustae TaxID=1671480 RepID=A0ABV7U2L1_9RHOB